MKCQVPVHVMIADTTAQPARSANGKSFFADAWRFRAQARTFDVSSRLACEIELLLTATLRQQPDNQTTVKMRGPGKHQKRLSAPSHWLLDKLSGSYAPKASPGPHKLRDCMPLIVFIRNRYATRKKSTLDERGRRH